MPDDRDDQIRRRVAAGEAPEALAGEYGISARRIYQIIGAQGKKLRLTDQHRQLIRQLHTAGVQQRDIAAQLGISRASVQRHMDQMGMVTRSEHEHEARPFDESELDLIRSYWRAGRTASTIARTLERSPSSIRQAVQRLGLPPRDARL